MSSTLFRTEVLEARRQTWLGAVSLDQPPAMRWLVLLAMFAAGGVAFGLVRGEYTRRTAVAGVLVPSLGVATVVAPVAGVVAAVEVEEGGRVLAGMALATIAIPNATTAGGTDTALARSLADRRTAIEDARVARRRKLQADADATRVQRDLARLELERADAELAARRRQLELADAALQRYRALQAQHYVTVLQLQQQEAAALDQAGAVHALERQAAAMRRQLAQFDQALDTLPAQEAQADADAARELAFVEQEQAQLQARRDARVQAPLTGRIATLLVQPGQTVQPGQPLLTLLPAASDLEAHLFVPGPASARIAPGDRVLLRYAAFPFQTWGQHGGRVVRVSGTALPSTDPDAEPLFRVVVAPDRQTVGTRALQPGQRLDAHVLGERRRLWEWVFEPLQTLRAAATAGGPATRAPRAPRAHPSPASERVGARRAIRSPGRVGGRVTSTTNARTGVPRASAATACSAPSIGASPAVTDADSSSAVRTAPMAADPGAHDVLPSPANGGRPEGACDA